MVSKSLTSTEPSEMVSKLIEVLLWACIDLLILLLAIKVLRIVALGDLVRDKESPGYEFSSPFSSNALNTLKKLDWRREMLNNQELKCRSA